MKHHRLDMAIISVAVVLMMAGLLAIIAVVWTGLSGQSPSALLTGISMWAPTVGFTVMLVEFWRMIQHKRKS